MWTVLSILMSLLCDFYTSGITRGCASGVSAFFLRFSFLAIFHFFGVTVKFLLLIGRKNIIFLLVALVEVPLGMPIQ